MFLSMGAFAQVTTVKFDEFPNISDYSSTYKVFVHIKTTWYIGTEESFYSSVGMWSVDGISTSIPIQFAGPPEQITQITHTHVELIFNEGICGTSNTFPGFAEIVRCKSDFPTTTWWYRNSGGTNY